MRTPPTLSDFARTCAYVGLLAACGVACLNPMPEEFPSNTAGTNAVGAAGRGNGGFIPPDQGASGGMSSGAGGGGGAVVGSGGSAQAGQAGSGSPVSNGGAPDAGAPRDSGAADEPDGGSGGP